MQDSARTRPGIESTSPGEGSCPKVTDHADQRKLPQKRKIAGEGGNSVAAHTTSSLRLGAGKKIGQRFRAGHAIASTTEPGLPTTKGGSIQAVPKAPVQRRTIPAPKSDEEAPTAGSHHDASRS